jgi:hypothetical protein
MKVTRTTMNRWISDLEETIEAKAGSVFNTKNEDKKDELSQDIDILRDISDLIQEYIDAKE